MRFRTFDEPWSEYLKINNYDKYFSLHKNIMRGHSYSQGQLRDEEKDEKHRVALEFCRTLPGTE